MAKKKTNNAYKRSVRREREIVNAARKAGFIAARSAGSKSPVDVWVFDPRNRILKMIQVKTHIGARNVEITRKDEYQGVQAFFDWWEYK